MESIIFTELGLGILVSGVCATIQSATLLALFSLLMRYFDRGENRFSLIVNNTIVLGIVWVLAIMHLVQVGIWAAVFRYLGCFHSFYQALYFSLMTYSTVGYGDLVAPDAWKLFCGVEAIMGVLMFGWSASFLFGTLSQFYKIRLLRHENR